MDFHVPKTFQADKRIFINGASSGLGAALARHVAGPGVRLTLSARNQARLQAVAEACAGRGAVVNVIISDLSDPDLGGPHEYDLAILAAGVGDMQPEGAVGEGPATIFNVGLVNFTAACALAGGIANAMAVRGGGQIVLIGSVAAFAPLPYAAAYVGSKAGLLQFGRALRLNMAKHKVGVTIVSAGFIDTPMSQRLECPKPLMLSAAAAAAAIVRAAAANKGHVVLPWPWQALRLAGFLPLPILSFIFDRLGVGQQPLLKT